MFYENNISHNVVRNVFQENLNFDNKKLYFSYDKLDILLKIVEIFDVEHNLQKTFVVVLLKLLYDSKIINQVSKRAYRSNQEKIVTMYIFYCGVLYLVFLLSIKYL